MLEADKQRFFASGRRGVKRLGALAFVLGCAFLVGGFAELSG
jgi:hypothetical protein